MCKDRIAQDVQELRGEAAEARQLAATFEDGSAVRDLLNYASALEREAAQLEKEPTPWKLLITDLLIAPPVV